MEVSELCDDCLDVIVRVTKANKCERCGGVYCEKCIKDHDCDFDEER